MQRVEYQGIDRFEQRFEQQGAADREASRRYKLAIVLGLCAFSWAPILGILAWLAR